MSGSAGPAGGQGARAERIQGGDVAAFQHAYDHHAATVYAVAYRVLGDVSRAQDVVQEVFLGLWRDPERYDPSRAALGRYLNVMARSRALDLWREAQVAGRAAERMRLLAGREAGRVDDLPTAATERRHTQAIVKRGLMRLPELQREAIVLAYWGGLTAEEIARSTGAPLGTIKSRIRLGLLRLRDECAGAVEHVAVAA
jgi:RNA polymerase sigma-70 factor, ECF subfamily